MTTHKNLILIGLKKSYYRESQINRKTLVIVNDLVCVCVENMSIIYNLWKRLDVDSIDIYLIIQTLYISWSTMIKNNHSKDYTIR